MFYDLKQQVNILIIAIIILVCVIINMYVRLDCIEKLLNKKHIENMTTVSVNSNESLQNLASAYNSGTATLNNLNITGNLTVNGISTLGKYKIRNDRIGIPGSVDLLMTNDKWIKAVEYDQIAYAGISGQSGGFASKNIWCGDGYVTSGNILNNGNITSNGTLTNNGYFANNGNAGITGFVNIGGSLSSGDLTATNINSTNELNSQGRFCYSGTDCLYAGADAWGNGYKNNAGTVVAALRMKK